jgi:ABC-type multidrug transport system fused ATPase/permease subunit
MVAMQRLAQPLRARGRALLRSAHWALRLAWSVSPGWLAGVAAVSLLRGLIPAGLALSARGIVNGAIGGLHGGAPDLAPLLPWLALGFGLTLLEGLGGLAGTLLRTRLRDDLNCHITADLLAHAARLDLAFYEDPRAQDVLQRAKDNPAGRITNFLANAISALSNAVQILSLLAILVVIEPWVVLLLVVLTIPYLRSQWRLAAEQHALEHSRTTKRRWTAYFVTALTSATSVGEVQLLRLAALLILDEPTASLDARAEHALFEQFRALAHGRTTIIVSHRFSTVSMAHRILVMDKGRIIESGTHAELLARAGHYAGLYDLHERTRLRVAS